MPFHDYETDPSDATKASKEAVAKEAVAEEAVAETPPSHGFTLSEKHRRVLKEESANSDEAIAARGAYTVPTGPVGRQHLLDINFSKAQSVLGECLVFPLHDGRGQVTDHAIRPTIPRNNSQGKPRKYEMAQGSTPRLDVAVLTNAEVDNPLVDILFTEGAKKADAASSQGLVAVSLNGVYGFRGKNAKGGVANLQELDEIPFKGEVGGKAVARVCLLAFDSDWEEKDGVYNAMLRLGGALASRGAAVKMINLPPGPNGEKTGLDDFFARGGTVTDLYRLATDLVSVSERERRKADNKKAEKRAAFETRAQNSGRPLIETASRQLDELTRELANAVGTYNQREMRLFHGAEGLSQLVRNKDGQLIIQGAPVEVVQDVATRSALWIFSRDRGGPMDVFPPREACKIFALTPHNWKHIPPLDSIVTAPFFDAEGNLCAAPGYHRSARAWLELPAGFVLPSTEPTLDNLESARHLILKSILGEVAFTDQASRAHAVALMILPFVRRLIRQSTPLHVFDSPIQSSGKSYTAELCLAPFAPPQSFDDLTDENEWSKAIFAALLEGRAQMFFDNITSRLSSPSLASYITSETKTGRVLGVSKTATVSTKFVVWCATSNNAKLSPDANSRSLLIRLDTGMERPEDRVYSGDPMAYIEGNRGAVCGAIITLVRAWMEAGQPQFTARKHRFASWSRIMGGILAEAGIDGFLENLDAARETMSPEASDWRQFVTAWFERMGDQATNAKDLLQTALDCAGIADSIGEKEGKAKRLGDMLGKRRDQVFAGCKITRDPQKTKAGVMWRLVPQFDVGAATGNSATSNATSDPSDGSVGDSEKAENTQNATTSAAEAQASLHFEDAADGRQSGQTVGKSSQDAEKGPFEVKIGDTGDTGDTISSPSAPEHILSKNDAQSDAENVSVFGKVRSTTERPEMVSPVSPVSPTQSDDVEEATGQNGEGLVGEDDDDEGEVF